jgi:hypothetical protein
MLAKSRTYNSHKLNFQSKQCVFLGYSAMHKGVKCLDVQTGRIYITRDVMFDETVFPFQSLHPNVSALLCKEILLLSENMRHSFDHGADNRVDHYAINSHATNPVPSDAENAAQNDQNGGQNAP